MNNNWLKYGKDVANNICHNSFTINFTELGKEYLNLSYRRIYRVHTELPILVDSRDMTDNIETSRKR